MHLCPLISNGPNECWAIAVPILCCPYLLKCPISQFFLCCCVHLSPTYSVWWMSQKPHFIATLLYSLEPFSPYKNLSYSDDIWMKYSVCSSVPELLLGRHMCTEPWAWFSPSSYSVCMCVWFQCPCFGPCCRSYCIAFPTLVFRFPLISSLVPIVFPHFSPLWT